MTNACPQSSPAAPRLAAFPKAFMQQLCKGCGMSVSDWIRLAAPLGLDGLEWYAGFLEMADEANWPRFRREVEEYPEFAQKMDLFSALVDAIDAPHFGVNYDPSNAFLAGDDPLELLGRVSHRVVTMHASDRSLVSGTLADLRREEEGSVGYARRLKHGEIGKGLNDYDAIFTELARRGFCGWISIEDGVDGMEQLERSVAFLRRKIAAHWPAGRPAPKE